MLAIQLKGNGPTVITCYVIKYILWVEGCYVKCLGNTCMCLGVFTVYFASLEVFNASGFLSVLLQIIHLKRFQFVNGRWIKSQKIVKFPRESFDPSAFLVPRDPALCQRKPLTPQGDDLSEPRVAAGEVKRGDAQNSAGEDDVLLSKSPSSLSANVISSPKGEEA